MRINKEKGKGDEEITGKRDCIRLKILDKWPLMDKINTGQFAFKLG